MQPRFVVQQVRQMAGRLTPAVSQAMMEVAPGLPVSARTRVERLVHFVSTLTKKLAARLATAR